MMNMNEIAEIFHKLDTAKHQLASDGYSFDFKMVLPTGQCLHTGIGTPAQMTMLVLIQLADIYKRIAKAEEKEISLEEFAETIKRRLIEFLDDKTISFGGEVRTDENNHTDVTGRGASLR